MALAYPREGEAMSSNYDSLNDPRKSTSEEQMRFKEALKKRLDELKQSQKAQYADLKASHHRVDAQKAFRTNTDKVIDPTARDAAPGSKPAQVARLLPEQPVAQKATRPPSRGDVQPAPGGTMFSRAVARFSPPVKQEQDDKEQKNRTAYFANRSAQPTQKGEMTARKLEQVSTDTAKQTPTRREGFRIQLSEKVKDKLSRLVTGRSGKGGLAD